MNFFELNQRVEEKKVQEIKEQLREIEERLIAEGFWQNAANAVGNFAKRAVWGPQAQDGSRPMANWTLGQRMNNALQPQDNRVTADNARLNQLQAQWQQKRQTGDEQGAEQIRQQMVQMGADPANPYRGQQAQGQQPQDVTTLQQLNQQLGQLGQAINGLQDQNTKNALGQQVQALTQAIQQAAQQQAAAVHQGGGI